jgi:hypothetical protein
VALPASHVRFALEIEPQLPVGDRGRFLAGTLYPDSRWVTGVPRRRTHERRFLQPDYPDSDFTLGVHVHCLCDRIQGRALHRHFGALDQMADEERWVALSALKMVQDMGDVQHVDMAHWLARLGEAEAPNGEDPRRVADYYDMLRQTYSGEGGAAPGRYRALWRMVGLDRKRTDKMMDRMDQLLETPGTTTRLSALHQETVAFYRRRLGAADDSSAGRQSPPDRAESTDTADKPVA